MGLTVTAYAGLTPVPDWMHPEDLRKLAPSMFLFLPGNHEPLNGMADPLETGDYYGAKADFTFNAGSYDAYNRWRKDLYALASDQREDWSGPFYELINFSDCEGTIGTTACVKLRKDFDRLYSTAARVLPKKGIALYRQFWRAFELASDGGAVVFH